MRWFRRLAIAIALLIVVGFALRAFSPKGPEIASGSTLVIQVKGSYVESAVPPLMARLLGRDGSPFIALLSQLNKAARDDRIDTVVLRIRGAQIGWGKAQELRDAIARLREAGRRTIAFLEISSIVAQRDYFVAVAADEVHIVPGGSVPLVGLAAEYFYLGGMFEKLGVVFEVAKAGRYKSAVESVAGTGMSEASREMANALLDSTERQFIAAIAEGRGLTPDEVRERIALGPVLAKELVAHGLADGVSHLDELVEAQGGEVVRHNEYAAVDPATIGFDPQATFALVYGSGNVVAGDSATDAQGAPVFAAGAFAKAIGKAAEADDVEAIIVRIDSPGGSALASELMWRAIRKASEEHEKPIIASFSDVAASGGYYVASAADAIVAPGASLTGSIGVFALRPVVEGLLDEIGVGSELLLRGAHADLGSGSRRLSDGARERLERIVLDTYDQFLERVADGRELETGQVDAIGQGRVWTGEQAHERGLVDELGGLREAVIRAKLAAGLDAEADVAIVTYPQPRSLPEQLAELFDTAVARAVGARLELPEPLGRIEHLVARLPASTPLLVPPAWVEIR
jgi:protease-4